MTRLNPIERMPARSQSNQRRRGCLFYVRRGLKWFGIVLVALVLLGVVCHTVATELDKRNYPPRGQLYTVNGHQMHMVCMGEGSPAVILQAGGGAESLWWYWVQNQMAEDTRVCAFDRPGYGWSEPTSEPRDALTIAGELHTLLEEAGVPAPYVMAGHSYGAVFTRIYAAQYPEEVVGLVLVDSAVLIPDHFASQSEFDEWQTQWEGSHTLFGVLTRIGLTRLLDPGQFQASGYPPDIAAELTALHSRAQVIDTDFAEFVSAYWALTDASAAAENPGNLPMAVLWASQTVDAFDAHIEGFLTAREEISTYSSNSVTRMIEGANHGSILGNEQYAQQVSNAILDVIEAAQTGQPLASQ
jgi:pimeloyl-ACP methyl ester carboxylesterase